MSKPGDERSTVQRVLHFPLTRIAIGAAVCGLALLGTNSVLRLVLRPETDFLRVVRWLLSTSVLLAAYHFLFRHYERREITELSRTGLLWESLAGLVAGAASISLVIAVLAALGYYKMLSIDGASALLLSLALFTTLSVFEELLFRGIVYRIAEQSLGTNLALIVSGLLFGLAHLPNEHANAISVISAASGGILAGLLFSMTRRLWLPIFFHAGWNWAQGSLGVAVSGIEELPAFIQARLEGPVLITGGAFGPENSVITVLLVLILAGLAYTLTLKSGKLSRISGFVSPEERKGVHLDTWPRWKVQPARDPALFLGALPKLGLPDGTLYLEGGAPPPRVRSYLEARAAGDTCKVQLGTIWPRPSQFHMAMTEENLRGLAELAEGCAAPELAIHVHVYAGGKMLLEWTDAFYSDPLYISSAVPEHQVRAFCRELEVACEQVDAGA